MFSRLRGFLRQLQIVKVLTENAIASAFLYLGSLLVAALVDAAFGIDLSSLSGEQLAKSFAISITERVPAYVDEHPLRVYSFLVFLSLGYAGARVFCRSIFAVRRLRSQLAQRTALLERVGLYGYREHGTNDKKLENWADIQGYIDSPQNRALCIMGATGWNTFGKRSAPLHDCLKAYTGQIRVLLIDPHSTAAKQRASSVGQPLKDYRKEIDGTISFCARLADQGKSIEVRTYEHPPTWKLIITAGSLWLQHYRHNTHVDSTSVLMLYPTQEQDGLYDAFCSSFERLWSISKQVAPMVAQNDDLDVTEQTAE